MKITGGSFGLEGSAFIHKNKTLVIEGATKAEYKADEITTTSAQSHNEKKTSIASIILGIGLTVVLTMFFSIIGFGIGVLITVLGSRYSVKHNKINVVFSDNKSIDLLCTPNEVTKIFNLNTH